MLEDRGLLLESNNEPPEYLLSQDPASLTIADLLATIRKSYGEETFVEEKIHSVPAVDDLIERIEAGTRSHLAGMTLRELVLNEKG